MTVWSDCNAKQSFGIGELRNLARGGKSKSKENVGKISMILLFRAKNVYY